MALNDTFRPTLLIGVGGTGISIAERVFALARQTDQGLRGRIGVLGFDTNTSDLNRLNAVEKRNQIALSTTDTIYQLLDKNTDLEKGWFGSRAKLPPDVLNMTLLDGAGQIRMLTRLGLHHALRRGGIERLIGDAVARIGVLNSRERFEGAVNVMLVGSLAGATGSGSFIQIALLVDQICRSRNMTADIRGLFLLPDVFVRGASLPTEQVPNVLANGYAALKELNAVNNVVNNRGEITPFVFEYAPGHFLREGGQPFRSVALIDFENVRGGSFGRSLPAYQDMAARAAYLLIFSPIGAAVAGVGINDVRAKLGAAGEGTHNIYAGIGVSAVRYPAEEMSRYLTLKLAIDNLDGDWLRLDRLFFDRARRYEELRRQSASMSVPRPEQGQAFLEDLDVLATKDRLAFFADIHNRLHPRIRDERTGSEVVAPRYVTYLDALIREITARFWARDRLATVSGRQSVDTSNLNNKSQLVDLVRRLENYLDDDVRQIGDALGSVPEDDFRNILATADDAAVAEWRDFHLQTYIIKDGPHLVEVRAFLYSLRRAIAQRRGQLNPDEARSKVFKAANVFDETRGSNPTDRRAPRITELAREAANEGLLQRLMRGPFEQFQKDYAAYYNGSMTGMRKWANESVTLRVLNLLDEEIENLERFLAGLFVELGAVFSNLMQKATTEEDLHGTDRGRVDGNVWVYADAAAKRQCWDGLRLQSTGLRLGADANTALATNLYRRYRDDRKARTTTDFASLGGLFSNAVVQDFSRKVVETEFRGLFDITIVEAIKREAQLRNEEWRPYLRHVVDVAGGQAEPFLSLTDANDGQRVIFWAVHPSVREDINDDQTFSSLFTFQQGEAPLEGAEFSAKELLCMNTRVNLELTNLAKLHPGDAVRSNINVPAMGSYAREYTRMVDGLIEAELSETGRAGDFTPHLDATWHRPGALAEIFPDLNRAVHQDAARASIISLGLGLLEFTDDYNRSVVEFTTVGKTAGGGVHRRLLESHDLWQVLQAFEQRPELVRAALRYWQQIEQLYNSGGRPRVDPMEALTAPAFVGRVVDLAVVRDNAEARENRLHQLLVGWGTLVQRLVALTHRELAEPGRATILRDTVTPVREAVFAAMRDRGVRGETLRSLERVFLQAEGEVGIKAMG